jgi:serine/threonine protein kinase
MDRVGLLNEEETVLIGAAICDALTYLHTRIPSIVHRDIKPGNVKITPQGHIFLVDFGLAKIIQSGQATTTGARAMTPGYSPPEQYGTARTDHRSDIFSLGATLYAALTGAIPEDALARAMDQVDLTPIRKRNSRISRRLANVIEKALAVRPDDRYQDAEEFKQALLNVRGITTRRKPGEYMVSPPPEQPQDGAMARNPLLGEAEAEYIPRAEIRSPLPVSGNIAINGPALAFEQSERRSSVWMLLVFLLLLLGLVGVAAYSFNPSWPDQVLSLLAPASRNTAAVVLDSPSETPAPSSTPEPVDPTASPTLESSPTVEVTATSEPDTTEVVAALPGTSTPNPSPTPMGGGSGQIAFASDRSGTTQIWLMNVDGSGEPKQITDVTTGACQPSWSPDGLRLAFISPCENNEEIYPGAGIFIINADGTGLTPLPTIPGGDFDPAWSPDGNFIAFTSLRSTGRPLIYRINLRDDTVEPLSGLYSYDRQPAWSPDGTKIAFVSTQKGPVQIWTMDANGSNQAVFSRSDSAINTHPAWFIDGEVILFNQIETVGSAPNIVADSPKWDNESPFNLGPWPAKEARYSPDGLWLAFESWPKGSNHDIYMMAASGAARTQLTDWERLEFDPAWRPAVIQP